MCIEQEGTVLLVASAVTSGVDKVNIIIVVLLLTSV